VTLSRRRLLGGLLGAATAWPVASALPAWLGGAPRARAIGGRAERLIIFYFPDGIAGRSQDGEAGLFDARASGGGVALGTLLEPLGARASDCTFVNGLSMGPADEGSHPGGAKKLLTATDGGFGPSIDQVLAGSVGSAAPFRHLYLGVQANVSGASGDKHISYPSAGISTPPEDDPVRAFARVFGGAVPAPGASPGALERSLLDTASADLEALRARLGSAERVRLDLHAEALREVERRLAGMASSMGGSCSMPSVELPALAASELYAPERFASLLQAQMDVMVTAMACGMTKVGVIQCSHHTSELVMSRIGGSEMYDPGYDMRSHQASHYGARHDPGSRLFSSYVAQRRWFVQRYKALLDALAARPEGDGTMLDHSVVLLCSEVSDGNTHAHSEMPFVLGGRGGGALSPGRVIETAGRRHGDLLVSIANAMGDPMGRFGDSGTGVVPGLLTP